MRKYKYCIAWDDDNSIVVFNKQKQLLNQMITTKVYFRKLINELQPFTSRTFSIKEYYKGGV